MSGNDFWSRRRAQVAQEEAEASAAAEAEEQAKGQAAEAERLAPMSEAELLDELGLPDPDTLAMGDDFTVFLKSNVPDVIRRRALRRLWRSNPVLANLDNLVDYGDDFTKTNVGAEGLKSAYEVGRGFLRMIPEGDAAANAGAGTEEARDAATQPADPAGAEAELHATEAPDTAAPDGPIADGQEGEATGPDRDRGGGPMTETSAEAPADDERNTELLSRRRMKFRFL